MGAEPKSVKVAADASLEIPVRDEVELDEMTPEQAEQFVKELLKANAETLRGLAQR